MSQHSCANVSGWLYEIDLMRDVRCNTVEDVLCQKLLCLPVLLPPLSTFTLVQSHTAKQRSPEKDVRVVVFFLIVPNNRRRPKGRWSACAAC